MIGLVSFDQTPRRPLALLTWACLPLALLSATVAFAVGNPVLPVLIMGGLLSALAQLGMYRGDRLGTVFVAVAFVGQAAALTAALTSHGWQIDAHMAFFAFLAMTISLGSVEAVLAATVAIALHHLGLTILFPALVYPSVDLVTNVGRTAMHGVIVVMEAIALCYAIHSQATLANSLQSRATDLADAKRESDDTARRADELRIQAEEIRDRAERDRQKAEDAKIAFERETERARELELAAQRAEDARRAEQDAFAANQAQIVDTLRDALRTLAAKDLGTRLGASLGDENEDLRRDFNDAVASLEVAINEVSSISGRLSGVGTSLLQAAMDLSGHSQDQTETIAGTSARISDISERGNHVAEGAKLADGLARNVMDASTDAAVVVSSAAESMTELRETAGRIRDIVSVIDDIAFRTNLLALNAGIEAARAGEAGRGFSVVAAEVGALARRAADSAHEIGNLTSLAGQNVETSAGHVQNTVDSLKKMTELSKDVLSTVSDIAGATANQANLLEEVDAAMKSIDSIGRTNASSAEASASRAKEVCELSSRLDQVMNPFRTRAKGDQSAAKVA